VEQPVAGEGEDRAGNWASVMEFPWWRKLDKRTNRKLTATRRTIVFEARAYISYNLEFVYW